MAKLSNFAIGDGVPVSVLPSPAVTDTTHELPLLCRWNLAVLPSEVPLREPGEYATHAVPTAFDDLPKRAPKTGTECGRDVEVSLTTHAAGRETDTQCTSRVDAPRGRKCHREDAAEANASEDMPGARGVVGRES